MFSLFLTQIILIALCAVMLLFTIEAEKKNSQIIQSMLLGGVIGALAGIILYPLDSTEIMIGFSLTGVLAAQLILQLFYTVQKTIKNNQTPNYYDDGTPPKFYITGDKHRHFKRVKKFCQDMKTQKKDVLIILGDSGINYYCDIRDDKLKTELSSLNITLLCLHGNKENRPQNVGTYGLRNFCGGKVLYEPRYPNILFAIDGEIYTFEGKKYMVIGGAHSVDKVKCLEEGLPFWEDEMPDDTIKETVKKKLASQNNTIYGMLTHTCPIKYIPTEMFISTRQNSSKNNQSKKHNSKKIFKPDIDRSTEEWLGTIEKKIKYKVWFCGHYHIDKQIDKINMMHFEIKPLHLKIKE